MLFETFCLFSCYNVKYVKKKKKAAVKKITWWHTIILCTVVYIYRFIDMTTVEKVTRPILITTMVSIQKKVKKKINIR